MENKFAQRLQKLREEHRLSYQDVADAVGLTKQSIFKFEKGEANPRSETVLKLASFFRVPYAFFYEKEAGLSVANVRFRDGHKVSEIEKLAEQVKQQIAELLEKFLHVRSLLDIKIAFDNPVEDIIVTSEKETDKAAKTVRKKWKLGQDPILHVINVLESKGVIVFEIDEMGNFEGLCAMVKNEIPVIVLNKNTHNAERKRFTALHELGHLVLSFAKHISDAKIEYLCNCFAGAILLVDEALEAELGKYRTVISLSELAQIREAYGISVEAIILRFKAYGFISPAIFEQWMAAYKDWSRTARTKDIGSQFSSPETTTLFKKMIVQAVNERKLSVAKAAQLTGDKIDALEDEMELLKFSMGS